MMFLRAWRTAALLLLVALPAAIPCFAQASKVPPPVRTTHHLPPDSLAGAAGTWYRLRTPHFEIIGNAPCDTLAHIAVAFETFRQIVQNSFEGKRHAPLPVVIFADEAAFAPYKRDAHGRTANYAGVYTQDRAGSAIAFNAGAFQSALPIVFHEYTHHVLDHQFLWVPAWFHEGAAEFFSSVRFTKTGAEIGWPPGSHRRRLKLEPWLPLGSLLVTSPLTEDEYQPMFYAESWALYHYLARGRKDGPAQLGAFLTALEAGTKEEPAFRASFGVDYRAMEKELRAWVAREVHPIQVVKLTDLGLMRPLASQPMSRADVLASLGLYALRATPSALDLAEAHFRAALAADSTCGRAWAGLGAVRARRFERTPAIQAFEQGILYSSQDPVPFTLFGDACLAPFQSQSSGIRVRSTGLPDELLRARALLARALEIEPDDAAVCAQFGFTYLFDPGDITDGITWMQHACELEPTRVDFAYHLFLLLWNHDRKDDARAVGETILARCHDMETKASVQAILNGTSGE